MNTLFPLDPTTVKLADGKQAHDFFRKQKKYWKNSHVALTLIVKKDVYNFSAFLKLIYGTNQSNQEHFEIIFP